MVQATFDITLVAVGLIPVAFLFVYALLSGRKKGGLHKLTGTLAILLDLTFSVIYMVGGMAGEGVNLSSAMVAYFAFMA